jgi:hypothetical protein
MCLSSINHKDEKISPLYINITKECTHALPVSDYHRSCQKLTNYNTNIKQYRTILLHPEISSHIVAVHKSFVSGVDV